MKTLAIKDICKKDSSSLKQKELLPEGKYPVYGASGIAGYLDSYHQENEYIGIVKDGSGIGRVSFYPEKTSLIGTMQYILPMKGYNIRYIGYCLQSLDLSKYKQGAAIPHIYFRDYGERLVNVTESDEEQQAIVSRLDAAFAKIDALKANAEKQLNDTRALFQAELSESMMPKEGWEYKKFKDISHSISDGDWIEKKDQSNTGIRLIQTGNIGVGKFIPKNDSQKFITEDTFKRLRCREIFEGDILISRLPNPLGRTCVLPKLDTRCITAVDCSIVRIKKEVILPYFIIYYTQSQGYFSKIDSESSGTTRARITRKKLEQTEIPVPPLSEQQQIVAHLDALSEKVKELEKINEQTQKECDALKQAMLREIFE